MSEYRIGVDIGGTFTDVAFSGPENLLLIEKVLSTPSMPGEAVITGIRNLIARLHQLGLPWETVEKYVAHGSTIVSNTVIERKGANTALITTEGFRDILAIGREMRYDLFDLQIERPEPLIPRHLRREVRARIEADGTHSREVDEVEVRRLVLELEALGVESFAICLLHAYRDGSHERKIREIIHEELGADVSVSLSSEIVPEIREYERLSTTVVNAYVRPIVDDYIRFITSKLEDLDVPTRRVFVMFSNGGLGSPTVARERPVQMAESGPAAAALGAAYFGGFSGQENLLAFDMGGTTAKACLIHEGVPATTTEGEIARAYHYKRGSGLPIKTPLIEMIEIGSGGGSLARIDDRLGLLAVGPRSAGAAPGPACYSLGGTQPTVTDADLVLGYLNPDYFNGGKMTLSTESALAAIENEVGGALGLPGPDAAWRIHDLVNENMANSIRVHCVEKGRDPSSYAMVGLGGAGPVHASNIARKVGIEKIIFPNGAGVLSALGLLIAPISFDFVRSLVVPLGEGLPYSDVNDLFTQMEAEAVHLLESAGVAPQSIVFERSADMRYRGQGFEIPVTLPVERLAPDNQVEVKNAFGDAYGRRFSRTIPGVSIECINWRVRASGPRLSTPEAGFAMAGVGKNDHTSREVYELGSYVSWPVYKRRALKVGGTYSGPALVEDEETTIVIDRDSNFVIEETGNVVVTLS